MEKAYNSFVCYRGKLSGKRKQYIPSEDVATIIAKWINENKNLDVHPALFEARCKAGEVSYDPAGIDKFIGGMKKVFAVICPDFFNEIIELYNEAIDDMTKAEAIEAVKQRLEGDKDKNIYYFELKKAFMQGDDESIVYPIIVENGTTSPTLGNRDAEVVIGIFGEKMRNVLRGVNLVTFDYRAIEARLIGDPTWNEKENANAVIAELESIPEVASFKEKFIASFEKVDDTRGSFSKETIKGDLQKCTQTISNDQQPKTAPGEEIKFRAGNDKIIYDPVYIRHNNPPPPFLAKCMVDEFNKNQKLLGLESDRFGFWDVDFIPNQKFEGISVCAVCFGTLILHHRLITGSDIPGFSHLGGDAEKRFTDNMNAGLNLLIALRNPYDKTWPSSWVFSDSKVDKSGTVNQTTLALSTLLSCDFLSARLVPDKIILRSRYEFIWESIECLLKAELSYYDNNNDLCKGWGYGLISRYGDTSNAGQDESGLAMTAFTSFVFDILQKVSRSTRELMEIFKDDKEFLSILKDRKERIDSNITCILHYFRNSQEPNNYFKRSSIGNPAPSLTHTSYVVKSLIAFLSEYEIRDYEKQIANEIIDRGVEYIISRVNHMYEKKSFLVGNHERFEIDGEIKAEYGKDDMDQYEHCVEFITAVTLMKIAGFKPEYKDNTLKLTNWIMNMYLKDGSDRVVRKGTKIHVCSSRESGLKYPIFYIYYYRMMLELYLKSYPDLKEDGEI